MPKRSAKSKSKRVPLRQKYKVLRKVREHHRKKRREERRKHKGGGRPAQQRTKDPGIPSQWPFKEQLIKEFAWKRQQILLAESQRREERKRKREVRGGCECGSGGVGSGCYRV